MNSPTLFAIGLLLVSVIANLSLGLVVFYRNRHNALNKQYFWLTLGAAGWTLSNLLYLTMPFVRYELALISYAAALMLAVAFFFFCLRLTSAILPPAWAYSVLGVGLLAAVVAAQPEVIATTVDSEGRIVTNAASLLMYGLFLLSYIGAGLAVIAYRHRSLRLADRARTDVILLGLVASAIIGLIFNLVLPIYGNYSYVYIGPAGSVVFIAATAYAIVRHRLFDIRFVAARSAAYALTIFTLGIAYVLTVYTLTRALFPDSETSAGQSIFSMVITLGLAVTFQPIRGFFDQITDKVFFRSNYDGQKLLDDVGRVVANENDVEKLVTKSLAIINTALRASFVRLFVLGEGEDDIVYSYNDGRDATGHGLLASRALNKLNLEMVVTDEIAESAPLAHAALSAQGIAFSVRLQTSKKNIGYICFGYKLNGDVYRARDRDVLSVGADELAVAIQSAMRFQEIQQFNETLQNRIDDATSELRRSNKKLQALDAVKDEFISMASHQLRTPLTSIKGYLSMVLDGDAGELNPMQRKFLEEAYNSSQRMVFLIGDFLNVSRLNTGKFVIEHNRTNLADMIAEEVEQLQPTAAARQLRLEYHKPARFPLQNLDENKLRQVVMNFMDNALFYSKPGGVIKVELTHTAHEILLKVKDQGIGVPAAQQHRLFEKFYRATNAQKARPDGSGIGLFLAKKVIVAHKGSVIFESTEGKGSMFGFRIPLAPFVEPKANPVGTANAEAPKATA